MTRKKHYLIGIALTCAAALLCTAWFQLGGRYLFKSGIGKYPPLLQRQEFSQNQNQPSDGGRDINGDGSEIRYTLPEQYHFYGRQDFLNESFLAGTNNQIPILNDRLASKLFFKYREQRYYLYYANDQIDKSAKNHSPPFHITYPDIYSAATDEIAFRLWENPEGYFILDNHLYYTYGKNYYHAKIFSLRVLLTEGMTEGRWFRNHNRKDAHYARLNLDTLKNEKISQKQYEEYYFPLKHNLLPE